jgi:hypothetical protein
MRIRQVVFEAPISKINKTACAISIETVLQLVLVAYGVSTKFAKGNQLVRVIYIFFFKPTEI